MAKARAIAGRRKAVLSIRKITRTMQLIATAKYQAAYKRATASQPYTDHITAMVGQLSTHAKGIDHPLLTVNEKSKRNANLILTSNRGMCGGYNAGLLRAGMAKIHEIQAAGQECDLSVSGKKGIGYFRFLGWKMAGAYVQFDDKPAFAEVEKLAADYMRRYEQGELRAVYVTYMKFVSIAQQKPTTIQLLPIQRESVAQGQEVTPTASGHKTRNVQFEFSPDPAKLLKELLPATVKARLYQCFTDAAVSEQVSRMVAMKAATDAAAEMIKILSQQYNRARQSQITTELLDIMGGVEAMK